MATIKKYNGSTWENAVVRKYGTASEIITPPTTIYADGTAISTYTIKGNTTQSGTPTPSNPVAVNGVGERTENLFNTFDIVGQVPSTGNGALVSYNGSTTSFIPINSGNVVVTKPENVLIYLMLYAANGDYIGYDIANTGTTINGSNISGFENARFARLRIDRTSGLDDIQIMLNTGSTAKPYEPWGYKIPISSASTTTSVYLGEVETTRKIKKLVFDGTEFWALQSVNQYGIANYMLQGAIFPPMTNGAFWICSHLMAQSSLIAETQDEGILINVERSCFLRFFQERFSTVDSMKKWLAAQYAAGTPVTVWYVLATPETAAVNEPLMKIGTYADTLSSATSIPTIEGANSITVDTTVQPSEFTATWTGWHDAEVKEKSENLWNEDYTGISDTITYKALYVGDGQFTMSNNAPRTSESAALLFLLAGSVSSGASTGVNGVWDEQSRTVTSINGYVTVAYRTVRTYTPVGSLTMLNAGATALSYEPYWK